MSKPHSAKASLVAVAALSLSLLAACGASSVGFECTQNTDCDSAQTCFTAQPGGFCSKSCSREGTVEECPGGSVCAKQGTFLLCSPVCTEQAQCRDGYGCNGISGTETKACRAN